MCEARTGHPDREPDKCCGLFGAARRGAFGTERRLAVIEAENHQSILAKFLCDNSQINTIFIRPNKYVMRLSVIVITQPIVVFLGSSAAGRGTGGARRSSRYFDLNVSVTETVEAARG